MKVVLYIGHHKVGSTALQQFLAQNTYRLLQNGILYPAVESEGMSFMLARALEGFDDVIEALPINIREPHNALAFRMMNHRKGRTVPPYHKRLPSMHQMQYTLDHQIAALDPHTVILCSEVMANFAKADLFLIDQIRTMFGPDVDIEIYCALRRPDEYLVSWHGQRLRFGHKIKALGDGGYEGYLNGIHFDYEAMLRPWVERCTKARFHIRPYSEIIAQGGSTADFTQQVGVDFPEGLLEPPRLNSSFPQALYEVFRQGNQALSRTDSKDLRDYLMSIRKKLELPENREVELFGAAHRETLYKAFLPIERWLCDVTGRDAFFEDLDQMCISRPQPEADVTAATVRKIKSLKIESWEQPEAPALEFLQSL